MPCDCPDSASRVHGGRGRRMHPASRLPAVLLAGVLLAAACTTGHDTGTRRPAAAALPKAAARSSAAVLEVMPAGYLLPAAVSGEVVLPFGGNLLIAGGLTRGRASTGAVTTVDPATGRARLVGRLAEPVHDAGGAVVNGRPFVFGGGSAASTAAIQAIAVHGAAAMSGRLPDARSDLAGVTIGDIAYLVGGHGGAGSNATVLSTRDGIHLRIEATLPVPVRYPAVVAVGQRIWVFGGLTPAGITDVIQQVNVRTGRARVVGHMPRPLVAATGFRLAGRIYLAGGQVPVTRRPTGTAGPVSARPASRTVLSYDAGDGAFSIAGRLPVPVAHAAAAVIGGTAYLVGGVDGRRAVPAVTTFRLVRSARAVPPAARRVTANADVSDRTAAPSVSQSSLRPPADAPWLTPVRGPGHLRPGSDPSVLPGAVLIADHRNNRLVIVDPRGRVRWVFPGPATSHPGRHSWSLMTHSSRLTAAISLPPRKMTRSLA